MAQQNHNITDPNKKEPRGVALTAKGRQAIEEKLSANSCTIPSLSKDSGIHRDTIEKILNGSSAVDCSSIHRLFDALGLKFDESVYEEYSGPRQPRIRVSKRNISIQQATMQDVDWIANLEYKFFKAAGVPRELLHEWYSANPNGFWVIWDGTDPIGHMDILPLKPAALARFSKGDITERGIGADDLYSIEEKAEVTSLYVESLIIDLPDIFERGIAMLRLESKFNSIINRLCDAANLQQICAMAATKEGDQLIRDLGFQVSRRASERADNHPFFSFSCVNLDPVDIASAFF